MTKHKIKTEKEIMRYLDKLGTLDIDKYVLGKIHALEWAIGQEEMGYQRKKPSKKKS